MDVPGAPPGPGEGGAVHGKDAAELISKLMSDRNASNGTTAAQGLRVRVAATPHLTSILKYRDGLDAAKLPYSPVGRSQRSEAERQHGRPPGRKVVLDLPKGYVDKPRTASRKRVSRRGLKLIELTERYVQVCQHFHTKTTPVIMQILQEQSARGTNEPPQMLHLQGHARLTIEECMALCELISQNANVTSLDLSESALRDDHMERISQTLIFRRSIDRLDLSDNNKIGSDGIRYLSMAVQRCVRLTYLNLSGIKMTSKMILPLSNAIGKSKLQTLIMHRAGFKSTSTLAMLVKGCNSCMSLMNLSLKMNDLAAPSGEALIGLVEHDTNLTSLDLRANCLQDAGAIAFAPAFANPMAKLTKLNLFQNGIGHAGAISIFIALKQNERLQSLDLSANEVGTPVAMAVLKELLSVNTALESIFLWKTGLNDEGIIALAEGLVENSNLKRLELRNNGFTAAGLMALSHALKVNSCMFKVMIDVPESNDKGLEMLSLDVYQAIQHHCALNLETSKSTAIVDHAHNAPTTAVAARSVITIDPSSSTTVNEGASCAADESVRVARDVVSHIVDLVVAS